MRFFKFLIIVVGLTVASVAYAGPAIVWDSEPTLNATSSLAVGHLNITGIDQNTPPSVVIVFSSTNLGFEPIQEYAVLGPVPDGGGGMDFSYPVASASPTLYFLPVIVDEDSYDGPFLPYAVNQNNFDVYVVGEVASVGTTPCPTPGDCDPTQNQDTPNAWPQGVIDNPLEVNNLNDFIGGLLKALLKIGIPILVVFLIYAGLRFVMARGNEKELEIAKKNFLWVMVGGAILLGAWTIVRLLKGTLDQIDISFIQTLVNYFV